MKISELDFIKTIAPRFLWRGIVVVLVAQFYVKLQAKQTNKQTGTTLRNLYMSHTQKTH